MPSIAPAQVAAVNARLQADPRYRAALQAYQAQIAALPPAESINVGRAEGGQDSARQDAQQTATQALGKAVHDIVATYGLPGQPQAWVLDPGTGTVRYEEDHSLRNSLLMLGAIAVAGGAANAFAAGPAAAGTALGPSTAANLAATSAAASAVPAGIAALPAGAAIAAAPTAAAITSATGPSTAASMAATTAAANSAPVGIAAVTAPAATHTLSSWLTNPAVDTAIRAGTGLLGAKLEANASRDAALIQQESFNKALDWEKSQYADLTGRLTPYLAAGTSASDRQTQLLGLPARPGTTATNFGPNSYALGPSRGDDTRNVDTGTAPQTFYAAMKASGLDPVAVQGHGQQIADAINKYAPGSHVTVDPKTDAVVWPGIGPVDVTVDSGKGGWSFRPSGAAGAVVPPVTTQPITPTNQFTTQPQARSAAPMMAPSAAGTVAMKTPDGRLVSIPQARVAEAQQRGAVPA